MTTSAKLMAGENILTALSVTLLGILGFPLLLPYDWHLFLHLLGAVLFVGNIIVSVLWMVTVERLGNKNTQYFAARALNWRDAIFTGPGIFLLLTNGFIIAYKAWGGLGHSWIMASLGLFILSGLDWRLFLMPLQNRLEKLSAQSDDDLLPGEFFYSLHRWYLWGAIAAASSLISLILMVIKPQLW